MTEKTAKPSRRKFLINSTLFSTLPFLPYPLTNAVSDLTAPGPPTWQNQGISIIGGYGPWATELVEDPPALSYRNSRWNDLDLWRSAALDKTRELIAPPSIGQHTPEVTVQASYDFDGISIEELRWQMPFGPPTEAVLLKPQGARGPLPAVLGLHDHGGQKYFGKRKITRTSADQHPTMVAHQKQSYSGRAWANELAKQGYVVLVHDTFTFGSRRVRYEDIAGITYGACKVDDLTDENPEDVENIQTYNRWAAEHEHIMAKSLFCGGTTWPGVTLVDDQVALNILCQREDVDAQSVGCCGLSGGGLRTDYLAGLDHRIKCAVSVGFMSTWKDFLMNKSYTHTWMTYVPLLPQFLDFPEVLGLRVPLATMVMNDNEDQLYTLTEMKRAHEIMQQVYAKAGAADRYQGRFYPGGHKFDAQMQNEAFDWFDRWLK